MICLQQIVLIWYKKESLDSFINCEVLPVDELSLARACEDLQNLFFHFLSELYKTLQRFSRETDLARLSCTTKLAENN